MIKMLLRHLLCQVRGHQYQPLFEQMKVTGRKGRHIRFLFRYTCCCCGRKTPWLRWSRHAEWVRRNGPSWNNRDRLG